MRALVGTNSTWRKAKAGRAEIGFLEVLDGPIAAGIAVAVVAWSGWQLLLIASRGGTWRRDGGTAKTTCTAAQARWQAPRVFG